MCIGERDLLVILALAGTALCPAAADSVQASQIRIPDRNSYLAPTCVAIGENPKIMGRGRFGVRVEIYTGYQ
jgi:hypothetical protein